MTKVERRITDYLSRHVIFILIVAATVLGLLVRWFGRDFQSGDMKCFLLPWWNQIEPAGLEGLATRVGNYNIPYQIITYLLTLLPIEAVYAYKLLSVAFDFVLAITSAALVYEFTNGSKIKSALTYSLVFLSINVIFNSAFWGQCDSIYVSFILLALYTLKKGKSILPFIFLGLSFAFKLQVIFILPFFIYYWFTTKKVSILSFLIIPAVDIIMCLPAVFLGRPFWDIVDIYFVQTDYGKQIQFNCPNFWALICDNTNTQYYYLFKAFSIFFTFAVLIAALAVLVYKKVDLSDSNNFLLTAIWSAYTCVMFLSSMHERYAYLFDILTVVYFVVTLKHIWLPIIVNLASLRGYVYYLFQFDVIDIRYTAVVFTACWIATTVLFVKEVAFNGKKLEIQVPLKESKEDTNDVPLNAEEVFEVK